MTVAPGERIDRLYELPLDEFIPARNALAAELRRAGERDAAAEVKTLRKPSRVASAVNRLVRAERELVEALLGAGGELRQAHRQAASGRGAEQLRAAADAERAAVEELLARLPAALGEPPSPALREAVRNTLHAASSDDTARELVAAGRLTEELRPVGLGPVPAGGASPAGGDRVPSAKREAAARDRRLREAHAQVRALQREAEAAERQLDRAADAFARAREAAAAAAERVESAEKRAEAARAGLREAQDALAALEHGRSAR